MDDKILDKLSLDCQESWLVIKDTVGQQLLGDDGPLMVPHLDEAKQYAMYHVFVKLPQSKKDKLRNRPRCMALAGHLQQMLSKNHKETLHDLVQEPKKVHMSVVQKYNPDYKFAAMDRRQGGVKKSVTLSLPNCEAHIVQTLQAGRSLQLDLDRFGLGNPKNIYIIQETYTTSGYNLQISIGDKAAESFNTEPIPVAFTLTKYPLLPGGVLGVPKPPNMKKVRKLIWLRRSEYRLATDPLPSPDTERKRSPRDQLPLLPGVSSKERSEMPLPAIPGRSQ